MRRTTKRLKASATKLIPIPTVKELQKENKLLMTEISDLSYAVKELKKSNERYLENPDYYKDLYDKGLIDENGEPRMDYS